MFIHLTAKRGKLKELRQYSNGNFICVFEFTIVNLATYRQFTNAAWDLIIKKEEEEEEEEEERKEKKKKIKIALSLGYPNTYFYNKRCNMLLYK